jgi:hypothetical protein
VTEVTFPQELETTLNNELQTKVLLKYVLESQITLSSKISVAVCCIAGTVE